MNHDPLGYYACLGVSHEASPAEIKDAFRRLAKQLHPDVNSAPDAAIRFGQCSTAYAELSDPERRAHYDAQAYEAAVEQRHDDQPLEPIVCSRCNKVTAQPRATAFRYVVSVILVTTTTPIQGIFCSACAKSAAIRASIISGLFGWWGIPWGPLNTIREIVRNATGGDRDAELNDRLTLYNAVAFATHGKLALAHAIARSVRRSSDPRVAEDADGLMRELEARGVTAQSPTLKSGWSGGPGQWAAHVASLLALPGIIAAIVFANSEGARARPYTPTETYRPYQSNGYTSSTPSQAQPTTPEAAAPAPEPLATCSSPPVNGSEFVRHGTVEGGHEISIRNGGSGNAIIKLRDAVTNEVIASMYIAQGAQATLRDLPDGSYRIMFATGDALDESCTMFAGDFHAQVFPGIETFVTETRGSQIFTNVLNLTLYNVPNGNVRPQNVSAADFMAG